MKNLLLITFIILAPATGHTAGEQAALQNATIAAFKQSGLEDIINKYTDQQLKHVPKEVKDVVGNVFLIAKCIQEKQIAYKWGF